MVNDTQKKHVASDPSLGGSLPLLRSPESDTNAVLRWVTGGGLRSFSRIRLPWWRRLSLIVPGAPEFTLLVFVNWRRESPAMTGGGHVFHPRKGTLGPVPGRRFQREKGLTQTSVSFSWS